MVYLQICKYASMYTSIQEYKFESIWYVIMQPNPKPKERKANGLIIPMKSTLYSLSLLYSSVVFIQSQLETAANHNISTAKVKKIYTQSLPIKNQPNLNST